MQFCRRTQLATLALLGEERRRRCRRRPLAGSAIGAIRSSRSSRARRRSSTRQAVEMIRHGISGFLGEINLLSGQTGLSDGGRHPSPCATSRSTATTLRPTVVRRRAAGRPVALPRSTPAARRCSESPGDRDRGDRPALVGGDAPDRRLRAAPSRLPYTWRDPEHATDEGGG